MTSSSSTASPVRSSLISCAVLVTFLIPATSVAQSPATSELPPALVERMEKESKAREACKKSICETVRSKKSVGDALACKVVKTWSSHELSAKVFKGNLSWKWGHAQCEADINLDRAVTAKIASEPKLDMKVGKHKVSCNLEAEDGKESHKLTFSIDPTVTFENGKATKAVIGWSDLQGATIVKTALWSATAVDNTFNVLQGSVVQHINDFLGASCDDVLK